MMTTAELIEKLKQADPSGEMDVLRYDSFHPAYFRINDSKVIELATVDIGTPGDYDLPGDWPENPTKDCVVIL